MKNINEETQETAIANAPQKANEVVRIDFGTLKQDLSGLVRGTVEQTLNGLLDAEAQELCQAKRYERAEGRQAHRNGTYERKLHTSAGEVKLKVPKLRGASFETQVIERYRRRQSSVEESLVEMYLAGVSVRRVEDITEALWGTRVSPSTISRLNNKIYEHIENWRNRPLRSRYVYVYLDGLWMKRSWGGEVENISVLAAIGVNESGYREVLGVCEGMSEDKASWKGLLKHLYHRGLEQIDLVISDKSQGLLEVLPEVYPKAKWQRCLFHFHQNILAEVPRSKKDEIIPMLRAIHEMENATEAKKKALNVVEQLKERKLSKAARILEGGIDETLTYHHYPREHHRSIRSNNLLERMFKEVRRRTRVVGCFPDGKSALMLVCARFRHIAQNWPEQRAYLDMTKLKEQKLQQAI